MEELRFVAPELVSGREVMVLRLLGRLGMVSSKALFRLLFFEPQGSTIAAQERLMYRTLRGLRERHLIWRLEGPREVVESTKTPGRRTGKQGEFLYGLTHDGRELLADLRADPSDVLERLISRDRRAPSPSSSSMLIDRAISTWCASVIDHARRTYLLAGLTAQARYVVPDEEEERSQTLGAVLTLLFDPKGKPTDRPVWDLPWHNGEGSDPTWRIVRFAVEVDTGLGFWQALLETANTYGRLTLGNVYDDYLGGAPRPVVIVLHPSRADKVGLAWHKAWPGTPAVMTSARQAIHDQHGALWGRYVTLKDNPAQLANLLDGLVTSIDAWEKLVVGWGSHNASTNTAGGAQPRQPGGAR
ncbi:MAG: hypothetical protein HGA45_12560 [Chloroflexales bacterium]|nr:hypothetical protein [Chloroflexales bacterium]